jgi:hypothetical protein
MGAAHGPVGRLIPIGSSIPQSPNGAAKKRHVPEGVVTADHVDDVDDPGASSRERHSSDGRCVVVSTVDAEEVLQFAVH